ncbi:hypothetical protein [Clostridium sp.]
MNIIFDFLSSLLNSIFSFTGDWGLAIVLLTVGVRLVLSPMSFKQKKIYAKTANTFYKNARN